MSLKWCQVFQKQEGKPFLIMVAHSSLTSAFRVYRKIALSIHWSATSWHSDEAQGLPVLVEIVIWLI
jgi:hypothetical protein